MCDALASLRRTLAEVLPGRIAAALDGYRAFTATPAPDDAKGFAAWHAAAKAAVAHMDLLVRLTRWAAGGEQAGGEQAGGPADDGLDRMLAEARTALAGLGDGDDDDDDGHPDGGDHP